MAISVVAQGDQVCTVGVEHDLPSAAGDVAGGTYYALFDLSAMVAGDVVELRAYEKVRNSGTGNTFRQVRLRTYYDAQDGGTDAKSPDKDFDGLVIVSDVAVKLTVKQTGGVSRTVPWKLLRLA